MHDNEAIEILKAILSKKVNPAAVPGLFREYEKAVAEILEPDPEQERLSTIQQVCSNCIVGRHNKCQDGEIVSLCFPNRRINQLQQVVIDCLCEQCHPLNQSREDGDQEAA